jgi:hypothetical protein
LKLLTVSPLALPIATPASILSLTVVIALIPVVIAPVIVAPVIVAPVDVIASVRNAPIIISVSPIHISSIAMAVVTVAAVIVAVAAVIVAVAAVVAPITAVVATAAVVAHSADWASWAKSGGRARKGRRFDAAARRHEHIFHCSTLQVSMFIDNVFGGFVNTSWA